MRTPLLGLALALLLALSSGCATTGGSGGAPTNPSFPLTAAAARDELRDMRDDRRPALRPVVVIGGSLDPGIGAGDLARSLRGMLDPNAVVISTAPCLPGSMDLCRDRLLRLIDRALPPEPDSTFTREVDIVAVSMGGLIARSAALTPTDDRRRLKIARLFTIATPHRGADAAMLPGLGERIRDMREGSAFLDSIEQGARDYELIAYGRLNDRIVGDANTAPIGMVPWWVSTPPLGLAHMGAHRDPRIIADIARRLRGETPYTIDPPAPLPTTTPALDSPAPPADGWVAG